MPGPVLEAHEILFKFFSKEGSYGFHQVGKGAFNTDQEQVVQKEGVWGMSGTKPDPRANVSMLKAAGALPIPSLWVVPVHQPQASSIVH